MAAASFVPLRIFSAYTMLEGAIQPDEIAARARELGFPAAALVDRNGLYAAMPFCAAAFGKGVQPIIGTLLAVSRPDRAEGEDPIIDWLPLLAQDETGYENLCALVSEAHLDRPLEEAPHVPFAALQGRTDGVIALTGGSEGALARLFEAEQDEAAQDYADQLVALFPDRLYVEISRRGDPIEMASEDALIDLAYARDLPLVATNPAFFQREDFHSAHDAMLCIADSNYVESDDRRQSPEEGWLVPQDAMEDRFQDLPEALANTVVIAQRCAFAAPQRDPILPSVAGDLEGESAQLREDARAGLEERLVAIHGDKLTDEIRQPYLERLTYELDIIIEMGFPGYFLIVADFIKWAKGEGIPVGPGRGSGAGSVVAWGLTITDLDPLQLGLLFERFLNPERVSMPDFDIDFCETRRGEVIRYVQQKYGRDQVAQIITFGTMKSRAVLRDVGRVLQMPYGQVDRLTKMVPNHPTDPWTLERALNGVAEFETEYKTDADVKKLVDLAMKLEGLPRHSSTHAAGVVIGDRRLDQLVPLYRDPRSDIPVTQFDMKNVEKAGLVKFDFLGLKTLSVLKKAVQLLAKRGITVDLDRLGWDDEQVYELLQSGNTVGVFQLESEGMRRTLAAVKPTCFEDIIALVSLYRPGPMDNIPMFGARKNGLEPIEYPHPELEPILKETYGIFVYQEQVMEAAKSLAGYSLGDADLLRRAMGKKIQAEMDAQRERFVQGCGENGTDAAKANELFDLIAKFAGYGFNKSHAAAYALIAYQTAWLKTHYPHEFFAASMCYDMGNTDKLGIFLEDIRRTPDANSGEKIKCLPPCVNASEALFSVEEDGAGHAVRYALAALKGVGQKAMEQLVVERDTEGQFETLDDFAARVDPHLLNKRQLESLAGAGAFDGLEDNRPAVFAACETILAIASSAADARETGQGGLFADGGEADIAHIRLAENMHWPLAERMAQEKEAFGFYFSGHPVDNYRHLADAFGAQSYGELCDMPAPAAGGRVGAVMAGMAENVRKRTSRRGNPFVTATLSDSSGQFFASAFDEGPRLALEDAAENSSCGLLHVELDWQPGEEMPRVTVRQFQPFDALANSKRMMLTVKVAEPAALETLAELLGENGDGRGTVVLEAAIGDGGSARVVLGRNFQLDPERADAIGQLPAVIEARLSADAGPIAEEPPKLALVS
ncbi:DNA polymerase III subunit alpha [Parasphingopyxis sp. CP4]|uniref:DNA polymerase III subunit alpha n=1 Tax=Parasphingopyxis sp. CP4 TaxID=2724527 RepID=UPI0015A16BF3|nr:DNA polymerase III subunit alpha [Parasphingopyxis sp. CP4]QLC21649.1 DNA polymerase III subunit alpha [Parasphingopyxis sp. CP4]